MDAKGVVNRGAPSPPSHVIAVILAGGQSARFGGKPKGKLLVHGERIVDRQLRNLRAVFPRVLLVTNDPPTWAELQLPMVSDRVPAGAGPLAGIDAALAALMPHETSAVCVAGDMPFLEPHALAFIRDHDQDADAVVPLVGRHPEPLFARYHRRCAAAVRDQLQERRFKMSDFLARIQVTWIGEATLRALDPNLTFLANVNTPEDLARIAPGGKIE
jgi:molybdopterin-guanine dinucleotide biosynthesis protein A